MNLARTNKQYSKQPLTSVAFYIININLVCLNNSCNYNPFV